MLRKSTGTVVMLALVGAVLVREDAVKPTFCPGTLDANECTDSAPSTTIDPAEYRLEAGNSAGVVVESRG